MSWSSYNSLSSLQQYSCPCLMLVRCHHSSRSAPNFQAMHGILVLIHFPLILSEMDIFLLYFFSCLFLSHHAVFSFNLSAYEGYLLSATWAYIFYPTWDCSGLYWYVVFVREFKIFYVMKFIKTDTLIDKNFWNFRTVPHYCFAPVRVQWFHNWPVYTADRKP